MNRRRTDRPAEDDGGIAVWLVVSLLVWGLGAVTLWTLAA